MLRIASNANCEGRLNSAAFSRIEEHMRQYLIVKAAEGLNHVVNWIALPGLYTLESAQQMVRQALAADPDSKFLIQEVGAA